MLQINKFSWNFFDFRRISITEIQETEEKLSSDGTGSQQ
jgi:hypothetical protein